MGAFEVTAGPMPVFTKGSTTATVAVPMTRALDGRRVEKVRPAIHLESSSGDVEVRLFQDTSNDGVSWDGAGTVTGYTTYGSAAGWTYGASFATVSDAPIIRFGLEARNKTATENEAVLATLVLEITCSA